MCIRDSRISVNIEIPNEQSLQLLAPEKDFQSVFTPMRYIQQGMLQSAEERKKYRHAPRFAPAGQSTQMIVGATSDSDKDILHLTSCLLYTSRRTLYLPAENHAYQQLYIRLCLLHQSQA